MGRGRGSISGMRWTGPDGQYPWGVLDALSVGCVGRGRVVTMAMCWMGSGFYLCEGVGVRQ